MTSDMRWPPRDGKARLEVRRGTLAGWLLGAIFVTGRTARPSMLRSPARAARRSGFHRTADCPEPNRSVNATCPFLGALSWRDDGANPKGQVMSITSRARNLSRATGLTHQQAVNAIRQMGTAARDLAAKNNWSLKRAEAFLLDPDADSEHAAVSSDARYVHEATCNNCSTVFFVGYDKKGTPVGPLEFCPACREEHGLDHCPRCGAEMLLPNDGVCEDCWRSVIERE